MVFAANTWEWQTHANFPGIYWFDLKSWLREQGLSARGLARLLEVPRTTVQDWVYRGAVPSRGNAERLNDFITNNCAHHWVIDSPNGPTSEGVCQRCGEKREFTNSAETTSVWTYRSKAHTSKRNGTIDHA